MHSEEEGDLLPNKGVISYDAEALDGPGAAAGQNKAKSRGGKKSTAKSFLIIADEVDSEIHLPQLKPIQLKGEYNDEDEALCSVCGDGDSIDR